MDGSDGVTGWRHATSSAKKIVQDFFEACALSRVIFLGNRAGLVAQLEAKQSIFHAVEALHDFALRLLDAFRRDGRRWRNRRRIRERRAARGRVRRRRGKIPATCIASDRGRGYGSPQQIHEAKRE
jgi:hypothetical protein